MFYFLHEIKQINTQTVQAIGQVVLTIEHLHIIIYDLRNRLSISKNIGQPVDKFINRTNVSII